MQGPSAVLGTGEGRERLIKRLGLFEVRGMTGPFDSILGRRVDRVLSTTLSFIPTSFEVAEGDVRLGGAIVDIDAETGRATAIRRVMLGEAGLAAMRMR